MLLSENHVYYFGWPILISVLLETFNLHREIWIATDSDNNVFAHANEPKIHHEEWLSNGGVVKLFHSEAIDHDWKESLVKFELTYLKQGLT